MTEAPTEVPTDTPTVAPTTPGTTPSPTQKAVPANGSYENLSMTMTGVTTLSESSWMTYEETYKDFVIAFYNANPHFGVTVLDILLEFVSQDPPARRRLGRTSIARHADFGVQSGDCSLQSLQILV